MQDWAHQTVAMWPAAHWAGQAPREYRQLDHHNVTLTLAALIKLAAAKEQRRKRS